MDLEKTDLLGPKEQGGCLGKNNERDWRKNSWFESKNIKRRRDSSGQSG